METPQFLRCLNAAIDYKQQLEREAAEDLENQRKK